jgi:nicotinate-nucleotide pyrophosphorylase (carboxylating)
LSLLPPNPLLYRDVVSRALLEDIEHGDITTSLTVGSENGRAVVVAKEPCVCAGLFVAGAVFSLLDRRIELTGSLDEGDRCDAGAVLLELQGPLSSLLQGERVALNFLQRLCGIATLTASYVAELEGTGCRLCDTRKTTPGLRVLEKYAVRAGGGINHRFGLSDGILIKDNHIAACGSVMEAVQRALRGAPHGLKVEVEVADTGMLRDAIEAGAQVLLLDNMEPVALSEAVKIARGLKPDVVLEASGNITLDNIRAYALSGVDIISSGALTHSCPAIDLSFRIVT